MDAVHTDQSVWVSWVMSKEVWGEQELRPLSCRPRNTAGAVPNLPPHKGGLSAPTAPPLFPREHIRDQGLLSRRRPAWCRP